MTKVFFFLVKVSHVTTGPMRLTVREVKALPPSYHSCSKETSQSNRSADILGNGDREGRPPLFLLTSLRVLTVTADVTGFNRENCSVFVTKSGRKSGLCSTMAAT